jgi:hypothetical protein
MRSSIPTLRLRGALAALCALPLLLLSEAAIAQSAVSASAPTSAVPMLRFGDFFQQPIGPRGLQFSDTLRAAQGRTVRLMGYMVAQESPQPGRFLLVPRPVRMSEHADGDADDLPPATVVVHLAPSQQDRVVPWREGLLALTGRLEIGRVEEDDGRVSWVRLVLPEAAVADAGTAQALR